jgi:hypothetical protein
MAPVYALIVSFVIVFTAGAVLQELQASVDAPTPTTSKPPASSGPATIRFTLAPPKLPNKSTARIADLRGTVVELHGDNGRLDLAELNKDGVLPVSPTTPFRVCAELPTGWVGTGGVKQPGSPVTCWGPFEPGKNVTLSLTGPAG